METSLGILAFGSLIDNPGAEIEAALAGRKLNIRTPFGVEFARSSTKRGGAPTLVPVEQGGTPVLAYILLVNLSEQEAKDRLWRREIDRVGQGGHYTLADRPRDAVAATPLDPVAAFSARPCRLGIAAPWRAYVWAFRGVTRPLSDRPSFHVHSDGSAPRAVRSRQRSHRRSWATARPARR